MKEEKKRKKRKGKKSRGRVKKVVSSRHFFFDFHVPIFGLSSSLLLLLLLLSLSLRATKPSVMINIFLNAAVSGLLAGIVATIVSVLVEKLGGIVGGVLASMPSTILAASIGMYLDITSQYDLEDDAGWQQAYDSFEAAMFSSPVGCFVTALLVMSWQVIARWLRIASPVRKVVAMLLISVVFWLLLATALTTLMIHLDAIGVSRRITGSVILCLHFGIGLAVVLTRYNPAPGGAKKPTWWILLLRGLAAAIAIFVSVLLAKFGGPYVGGVASMFPAIFLTTMVSLWILQGEKVVLGAASSMTLGLLSVPLYALLCSVTFFRLGLAFGVLVALVVSVGFYGAPLGFFLRWRQRRLDLRYSQRELDLSGVAANKLIDSGSGGEDGDDALNHDEGDSEGGTRREDGPLLSSGDGDDEDNTRHKASDDIEMQ